MMKYGDIFADVAELVDALDLGSSVFDVWVRVPPSALTFGSLTWCEQCYSHRFKQKSHASIIIKG